MMLFKYTYLKYFFLLILSIRAFSYVVENTALYFDQEVSYQLDLSDVENDNDEETETEVEEIKKVIELNSTFCFSDEMVVSTGHFKSHKNYKTRYLEFTTPPPEVA